MIYRETSSQATGSPTQIRQRLNAAIDAIDATTFELAPALESARATYGHYDAITRGYETSLKTLRSADQSDPRVLGLLETGTKMLNTVRTNREFWCERYCQELERTNKLEVVRDQLLAARHRLDVAQQLAEGHAHLASLAAIGEPLPNAANTDQPELREALRLVHEAEALAELKEWS
ncbi:hypothetical protein [Arthrobacter crystallopoietes]|uniref:Uncharacterized protein n=1 Tax=Crystallibacter crystallopoietes TaxID=37928 RepID=A0A1H1AP13_9MICC|nr:hypothetical protein [Arthrobacter crystallopoietes]AUI51454.1 hypothetical protein AC20117_12225 [Arthrobacter crystallopoietes]SDQ41364.1 hypothetical protein SAMN04489742_1020 [Arthrobacter crystallopoietes]